MENPQEEPKQKYALVDTYSELDKMLADKPKQETLEEAANRTYPKECDASDNCDCNWCIEMLCKRMAFSKGAKSEAARDYWFKIFKEQFIVNPSGK
jgi:hypothetical protein